MNCIWALFAFIRLHFRLISIIIFGGVVFAVGGFAGTYFTLFGDIDVRHNHTQAIERGFNVLKTVYEEGRPPHAFTLWGSICAGVYGFGVMIHYVWSCSVICRRCGEMAERVRANGPWPHHAVYRNARGGEEASLRDAEESLSEARDRMGNFHRHTHESSIV